MEKKSLSFFIVDDDPVCVKLYTRMLEAAGHTVTALNSTDHALEEIIKVKPDCVLCDLILPNLDGLQFFQQLKQEESIKQPIFIIITSKEYIYDYRRAFELGVNGYINKSSGYEAIIERVLEIVNNDVIVRFWGVRGTLAVPGANSVRYGGNTNCVTLEFPDNNLFIFDAGSGIKELSRFFIKQHRTPVSAKIFITHPHWDHINGIPFFVPFYVQGNEFEIFGSNHHSISLENLISDQMNSVYFPVTLKEFAAKVTFHSLSEEQFNIGDIHIQTILLNHPGRCLGYKVTYKDKVFSYITDNEIYFEDSPSYNEFNHHKLQQFIEGSDLLIMDATYSDKEYVHKMHWGHSCVSRVVDMADAAKIPLLALYHHDPDQFDVDIDNKLAFAQARLKERNSSTICICPSEGDRFVL